jgi:uncharacterized protein (DUF952 family)
MSQILHITPQPRWEQAVAEGEYRGDTLASEGFIHCSTPAQLRRVAETCFKGQSGLVVLRIDPERVGAPILWESPPGSDERFPHIYGPLNVDAVIAVDPLEPDETGPSARGRPTGGTATSSPGNHSKGSTR